MTTGPMRYRLSLQLLSTSPDSFSNDVPTWTTIGEQWGSIHQISGNEAVNAGRIKSMATHEIRLRYVTPINPATHRLVSVANGTVYNIDSANDVDGRKREYLVTVIEVTNPA